MAKVALATQNQISSLSFGTTYYFALGLTGCTQATTEADVQRTFRSAGTLDDMYINVSSNSVNGASTLRVRVNGGNGNQNLSITASTAGEYEDVTNTDSVSAGDEINYSLVTGGSSGTMNIAAIITNFAASSNTVSVYTNSNVVAQAFNTTRYRPLSDSSPDSNTTEARARFQFNAAETLQNFFVYASANTIATSASTARIRVDGANGNNVISITASTTGIFEDTGHTDSVAANSYVNYSIVTPNTSGSLTLSMISIEGVSTGKTYHSIAGNANGSNTSTTANNFPLGGRGYGAGTESSCQRDMRIAADLSNVWVNISSNSATGASTFTLRVNTADSAVQASITASTAGDFEDTTHSVSVVATDVVNYQMIRGGTGTVTSRTAGCMVTNTEVTATRRVFMIT